MADLLESSMSTPIPIDDDDLLTLILIRINDPRTIIRIRTVCKRWNSLIANPYFVKTLMNHHSSSPWPCSFLVQADIPDVERLHNRYRAYHEFSSNMMYIDESLRIYPKYAYYELETSQLIDEATKPQNFQRMVYAFVHRFPNPVRIRASFDDLLLFAFSDVQYALYIPETKRLIRLPMSPYYHYTLPKGFGLVCKGNSFRVVLFHRVVPTSALQQAHYFVSVYSSETLKWTRHDMVWPAAIRYRNKSSPNAEAMSRNDGVVCCHGILYWKHTCLNHVQCILRFDPFAELEDVRWGLTRHLPRWDPPVKWSKQVHEYKLCAGVSEGRLRICRMSVRKFEERGRRPGVLFEVWELAETEKGLRDDSDWRLVHCNVFEFGDNEDKYMTAFFDPNDERFVFLCDEFEVFRYNMATRDRQTVGEISWEIPENEELTFFPVFKRPWPTQI